MSAYDEGEDDGARARRRRRRRRATQRGPVQNTRQTNANRAAIVNGVTTADAAFDVQETQRGNQCRGGIVKTGALPDQHLGAGASFTVVLDVSSQNIWQRRMLSRPLPEGVIITAFTVNDIPLVKGDGVAESFSSQLETAASIVSAAGRYFIGTFKISVTYKNNNALTQIVPPIEFTEVDTTCNRQANTTPIPGFKRMDTVRRKMKRLSPLS